MGWVWNMNLKNNGRFSWIRRYPLHLFIFASYPILTLLVSNLSEVGPAAAPRALAVSLIAATILVLIFQLVLRDLKRAALISTIILILFYSYGHVYILLKGINIDGLYLFRHRTLLPIWVGLSFFATWQILRKSIDLSAVTYILNVVGGFLLIFSLFQLTYFFLRGRISLAEEDKNAKALDLNVGSEPPDIYYIILDGYGRSDVLMNEYAYDNSDFLNALRDLGFYVADCSQSNYAQTQLSLSSSLNFNYIDDLTDRFMSGTDDRAGLDVLIKHSAVRESLEKAGYKTVAFATGFLATEFTDADYFLAPQRNLGNLNEFEYLLIETTIARLIQDTNNLGTQNLGSERFRERTLFVLDKLDKLSYIKEPKFVFVHLIVPHPPYVFGATGGPVAPENTGTTRSENDVIRYRDQVMYISSRMLEIIPKIIANSTRPPIIVIQGDHGPTIPSGPQQRMRNLSVYYLPGVDAPLYSTITPVNTFRVIFNTHFGQNLPLLDDMSLHSNYDDPFSYKTIPNTCEANP
jgi:hypothetical protein